MLISDKLLKAIAHYYAKALMSIYQNVLNINGYRSSRRLGKLYRKMWGKLRRCINT